MSLNHRRKSIFGMKILNSKESVFFAYFLIVLQYSLVPMFGSDLRHIISGSFFLLISNLSILILTFNSIFQRRKDFFKFWFLLNLPLWCLIPIQISIIYKAIIFLVKIIISDKVN